MHSSTAPAELAEAARPTLLRCSAFASTSSRITSSRSAARPARARVAQGLTSGRQRVAMPVRSGCEVCDRARDDVTSSCGDR
jgi:hypothetical protein